MNKIKKYKFKNKCGCSTNISYAKYYFIFLSTFVGLEGSCVSAPLVFWVVTLEDL
jgi:hypothetical protein